MLCRTERGRTVMGRQGRKGWADWLCSAEHKGAGQLREGRAVRSRRGNSALLGMEGG